MSQPKIIQVIMILLVMQTFAWAHEEVAWESGLDAACARAFETGKPILICMHSSSEKVCHRMVSQVYTDPDVKAKMALFVVLPTCYFPPGRSSSQKKRLKNPFSTSVEQQVLVQNEVEVREQFYGSSIIKIPQHVFVGDDGEIFHSHCYELKKSGFLDLLDKALVQYGMKKLKSLDKQVQAYFKKIKTEKGNAREEAVKEAVELMAEDSYDLLYATIQNLRRENDRAACIRAMGYRSLKASAPVVMRWLLDKSTHIKNCAVVTLEEMEAAEAAQPLLDLYPNVKDAELKKDIIRALGPCSKGNTEARDLIKELADHKNQKIRLAAYLSLGFFLENQETLNFAKACFKKEKSVLHRTALVYSFQGSRDSSLVTALMNMVENEKNQQIRLVADSVASRLRGRRPSPEDRGARDVIRTLFSRDKIIRNEMKKKNNNKSNKKDSGGNTR